MKAFLSVGRSVLIVGLLLLSHQVNAETPDEWIALGARVHNGFGALVAVGVKIGLDAVKRLNAGPGDLKVTYYDGDSRRALVPRMASQSLLTLRSVNAT
ncbi:MAG: hypothetical protein WCB74_21975 [Pseudolabrys sp.]